MFLVLTMHTCHPICEISYTFSCTNLLLLLSKLPTVFRIRMQTHWKAAREVVGDVAPLSLHFLIIYGFSTPLYIPVMMVSPFLEWMMVPSDFFLCLDNCWGIAICLGMLTGHSEFFYSETHSSYTTLLSRENLSICLYRYFICVYLPYFKIHGKRNCVYVIHFSILRFC